MIQIHSKKRPAKLLCLMLTFLSTITFAQVPKPADVFGFEVGADYSQMLDYYSRLDKASDRVQMI